MQFPARLLAFAVTVLSLASASRAEVRLVDPAGHGQYPTIAAALTNAADGDLVLVRSGTYSGFTLLDRDLAIVADAGATVIVEGTIFVAGLPAGKSFVLSGLDVRGPVLVTGSGPALRIENAFGHVRLIGCSLRGGDGSPESGFNWEPGANALETTTVFDLAVMRCTILGGEGAGSLPRQGFFDFGAKGGDAVRARFTAAAFYDCTVVGGDGGGGEGAGGAGGRGYNHDQGGGGAMFSGCTIEGGQGGYAHGWGIGGAGGHAMFASTAAHHHLLDDVVTPGAGGQSTGYNDAPAGQTFAGTGTYQPFSGSARRLASPGLVASGGALELEFTGLAGDRLYVAQSGDTLFRFRPSAFGVWLLPMPSIATFEPTATLAASGTVTVSIPVGALQAGAESDGIYLQGLVHGAGGERVITSALFVQRLSCATLVPDCDGDGSFDTCQILADPALDSSHDGVLDACEPDCNANGIPDGVEISQGLVADVNTDGVPDPCEAPEVIHVDASAPPFGNGSALAPFMTLSEGLAATIGGDTLLVADGTYSGLQNRALNLAGRDLLVRSANGAAGCVIDAEDQSHAFWMQAGESAVFEGLTIRNARGALLALSGAELTVRDCVFQSSHSTQGGGAIFSQSSTVRVEDCVFEENGELNTFSPGGAIRTNFGSVQIRRSTFSGNRGSVGGALLISSPVNALVEACDFRGNQATARGGGLFVSGATVVHGCLVAGNQAPVGGGIGASENALVSQSTIVANASSERGGGLYLDFADGSGPAPIRLHGSIVWGNSAPAGAQIATGTFFVDTLEVRSSDVQGGQAAVALLGGTLDWDGSNFDLDPLFVLPSGPDGDPATLGDNDWRLSLASPCIDSGDNGLVPPDTGDLDDDADLLEPVPLDLDLLPRFVDVASVPDTGIGTAPLTDRGAYERQR